MIALGLGVATASALLAFTVGLRVLDGANTRVTREPPIAPPPRTDRTSANTGFTPLDVGETTLRWPSEQPWHVSGLPGLRWPSDAWPTGLFSTAAAAKPAVPSPAAPPPQGVARPPQPAVEPARPSTTKPPKSPRPPPDGLTVAEALTWAETDGLASAVAQIRERTGWTFEQSAKFLADAMRSRRSR
jgi:hypothetical protein